MKAVLLCAGFGTRLYPLTRDTAKPLLEVSGRPIVEHFVEQLVRTSKIETILLVSNARFVEPFQSWANSVAERFPDARFEVLNDGVWENDDRLGTVRDLAFAVERDSLREPVLVAAADNLYDTSFTPFFDDYFARPRDLILAYHETDPAKLRRTGVAEADPDGRLVHFWEKPEKPPTDLACPAFYILEAASLALLERYVAEVPETDAIGRFIAWLAERRPVYAHIMKGRRLDIGNIDNYHAAESWLRGRDGV